MLIFLASVLEQLDLALEHIAKKDVHNARFSLILTDNAIELVLHQIAIAKASELKTYSALSEQYAHHDALNEALGRKFDKKVNFAKIEGSLSCEVAQTMQILHQYRNEVYHIGIQHESILPALSTFYFDVACEFLGNFKPRSMAWNSTQRLPERAMKYLQGPMTFNGKLDDFANGCLRLRETCKHNSEVTIAALADEMDAIIDEQDTCINFVAEGVYVGQKKTRDEAVLDTQAWRLAFSDQGRKFAKKHGWRGNTLRLAEWLKDNYPHKFRSDPIPSWRRQAARLRANLNPHTTLSRYQSFIDSTVDFRKALYESAAAAEREIDAAIDRARER